MSETATPVPTPPPTDAPIIARASNTVRNKNLLILLMCLAMACWFAYDGWVGYPGKNDQLVANTDERGITSHILNDAHFMQYKPVLDAWHGWNDTDLKTRNQMSEIANELKIEGWKTETDIQNQQYYVYVVIAATLAAFAWFVHCQRRRAIAQGDTVSPSPGVIIPWQKITLVDNARWKTMGIVQITYDLGGGEGPKKAKFDDYETEREPLLLILDQLAEKAVNAEFIPKEEVESGGGVGGANAQGTAGIDGPTTGSDAKTEGSGS